MNNIKTVEVISPIFGLSIGDILSRDKKGDKFRYYKQNIGDGFSSSVYFETSEECIESSNFSIVEWFPEVQKTKNQKIVELKRELEEYRTLNSYTIKLENSLTDLSERHSKVFKRINSKLAEFKDTLNNRLNSDQCQECNREELTTLYNMIDLLEKIKA